MRISDQQQLSNMLVNLQSNQERLARSTERATTNLQVARPSDDPTAFNRITDYDGRLTKLAGYDQNIEQVRSRLSATDSTLQSVQGILTRLRELSLSAQSPGSDSSLAASEAESLRSQLGQLLNKNFDGEYLFSGYSGATPFTNNVFGGDNQKRAVEVSPLGATVFGVSSKDAFGVDPGQVVYPGLDSMIAAMKAGDSAKIRASLDAIDGYQKQLAQAQTLVGGQLNTLDVAKSANDSYKVALTKSQSELRDADPAEAYSKLAADRYAVEATYAILGQQNQLSILKYL